MFTLINVCDVEPENQDRGVEMFAEMTDNIICKQPGFISANIHKSLDGKKVVIYAQWRSEEDFRAVFKNPEVLSHLPDRSLFSKLIKSESVVLYEVCYINHSGLTH